MPAWIDRTGARYGRWVVEQYQGRGNWLARCDCGTEKSIRIKDAVSGKSTSCGCYAKEVCGQSRRTHGMSETRVYAIWLHMRQRCLCPTNLRYPQYGGNGITICDRWQVFENFYADMGDPPHDYSIDRIDNTKGYSPDNCRWATQKMQVHNSSSTKLTDLDVAAIRRDTRQLKVIAAEYGVTHTYVCALRRGKYRSNS